MNCMRKATKRGPSVRVYSIKTVCAATGLLPVTLRAWESRYRLVVPSRSKGNYRQYSGRDLALLRWTKQQVDAGTPIRLAAAEARRLGRAGMRWEAAAPAPAARMRLSGDAASSADALFRALIGHTEGAADRGLEEARARFGLERTCLEVIAPCLWRIGDEWERGKIRIAEEHVASTFLRGRLLAWFQSLPGRRSGPFILVGCAPQEFHDIGGLMLALLLRETGRRVEFLGQDLNLADLRAYAREIRPAWICLSANAESTAGALSGFQESLATLRPHPRFGYGGRAFVIRVQRAAVPGIFLGDSLPEAVKKILRYPAATPAK